MSGSTNNPAERTTRRQLPLRSALLQPFPQAQLPAGKMLMLGVVSHATNFVEHPQLVANRFCGTPRSSA